MKTKLNSSVKNAIVIGSICSFTYLAVYVVRNVLSAVSPQMLESGVQTNESIGTLSSLFFIVYAIGQLINGIIGDKIKSKYMMSFGVILAGICTITFTFSGISIKLSYVIYGATGFFLSMIYGPMTKLIAENTEPRHATRCSLGYTFSSLLGSPAAGILAAFLVWQGVFCSSGALLIITGILCFIILTRLEKKGIIQYNKFERAKKENQGIKILFKYQIIRDSLVSIITGIIRTAVVFWLPTYLAQYLSFSAEASALIFTVATLVLSLSAFLAVFICEKLNNNMNLTVLVSFIASAIFFLAAYLFKTPVINILFMILAVLASNCAAAMLWSRYCPGLRDTGMVSSATGFLDFLSYMAASVSSAVFANAVSSIGWGKLILIWSGLMVIGIVVMLPLRKLYKPICKR